MQFTDTARWCDVARINDNGIDREMTADEKAAHDAWAKIAEEEQAAYLAQIAAQQAARQSVIAKLAALGLTEAEIAALLGA